MPIAPPVVGPAATSQFPAALQLYNFIKGEMPCYNPGSLTAKGGWAVTAWILHVNQIDPCANLSGATAPSIKLH